MTNQHRIKPSIIGTMILLISAVALCAQEPPPPNALGGNLFFARMEGGPGGKLVKGAPYSAQAVTEINQTLSDGNQIHRKMTAAIYRDSEGRTRREETLGALGPWAAPEGTPKQIVMINDPVAGVNYVLDSVAHTARRMPAFHGKEGTLGYQKMDAAPNANLPAGVGPTAVGEDFRGFEKHLAEEGGAVQTDSLGTQLVGGVQADGTRITMTMPAGSVGNTLPIQVVTERWYSSQLQTVVMSTRNDPRVGTTAYHLTNVIQAEPPATLFQVPSDYTIQDAPQFNRRMRPTPNP